MKRINILFSFIIVAIFNMGTRLPIYSQSPDPTIVKLDSILQNMGNGLFNSRQHTQDIPPAFVRNIIREAIVSYDLPQDADTLLVLCDTYDLIGTGSRYVHICTEKGSYASYVKQYDNQLQLSPINVEGARPRLEYLLGKIRLGDYACLSDDSTYINSFADHWTKLYFCLFVRMDGEFSLCYFKIMGQDIKEVYQRELAKWER